MLSRTIRTHLEVKQETEVHFLVVTVILGFLSIFKQSMASSPFEALNSVCLSRCQSDVIPPVQKRRGPTDFSRTLCSSIKQIEAPYLFDWEQGIAQQAMQGNRASSFCEREV